MSSIMNAQLIDCVNNLLCFQVSITFSQMQKKKEEARLFLIKKNWCKLSQIKKVIILVACVVCSKFASNHLI